ncbi:hypothetical protein [Thermocoleostomius sinensis]|uniref:Uncharacterized protein n=1 Tax=Thermocoleostomius sinensis A174 TaxID=2016057 RepID=A0A9E9C9G3_9CYAN|nr:hypothetical protein [Thermocoleostomius sinensis]WAL61548.1 hypothetical protein OXH18_06055 [Thermocoleostomius sinensis A174]
MTLAFDLVTSFKPGQILYLEHQDSRLYAEVIQLVCDRNLCWVRPIALLTSATAKPFNQSIQPSSHYPTLPSLTIHDLRQGADLLCPPSLWRVALDTEVIPLLAQLETLDPQTSSHFVGLGENRLAHSQLREFIGYLWQANPEVFD